MQMWDGKTFRLFGYLLLLNYPVSSWKCMKMCHRMVSD